MGKLQRLLHGLTFTLNYKDLLRLSSTVSTVAVELQNYTHLPIDTIAVYKLYKTAK